ncbi:MAG: hypothetical protein JJ878_04170 [Alphaproteobacteria bacterium]|nr:hypothetical protein [Alphaproteobacteria bacterium]
MSDGGSKFDLDFDMPDGFGGRGNQTVHKCLSHLNNHNSDMAIAEVEQLRKQTGDTALVRHLLALCVCRLGRVVPAIRMLESAHAENPDAYEHVEVLAALLTVVGQRTEGVYYAKLATALKPAYPEYRLIPKWLIGFGAALAIASDNPVVENGYLHIKDGAFERAAQDFIDAIDLDRTNVEAWQGLVDVNRQRLRPGDSLRAAEALASLKEDDPQALWTLARCRLDMGLISEAWETVNQALNLAGVDLDIAQGLPALVRWDDRAPFELSRQLSDAWNTLSNVAPDSVEVRQRESDNARFRVGVLSGALVSGSEKAALLSTIDESLGRAADLHYYSNSQVEDSVTRRLRRSAQRWRDISKVDDETVATIIRNDEIQVLLDLDGYDWTGRPGVVARKPAPVVLSVMGEAGAVPGAQNGVLALHDPGLPNAGENAVETVVVNKGLSTWPLYVEPETLESEGGAPPATMRILIDAIAGRLSPGFLNMLASAVRKGMTGLLTIRGDDPEDDLTTEILSARFEAAGLNLATVNRVSRDTSLSQLVREADIFVDVTPVPSLDGALTALRFGVPVLSCRPVRPQNGACASLLYSLGLEDWLMSDEEAFADRLAALSGDLTALRSARRDIRAAVAKAASLDARVERGRAFTDLFDRLLAAAGETA